MYVFPLSSSPAYIYRILLEYHPNVVFKPFLCRRPRSFAQSFTSTPSSSSYQRRDRRRHPTSHLLRILRWSSCSPQRHPYPALRWKRTFSLSLLSCLFHFPSCLFLQFSRFHVLRTRFPSTFIFSQSITRCRYGVSTVGAPFPSQLLRFTFFARLGLLRQETDFRHSFPTGFVGRTSKTFFARLVLFSAQMSH